MKKALPWILVLLSSGGNYFQWGELKVEVELSTSKDQAVKIYATLWEEAQK